MEDEESDEGTNAVNNPFANLQAMLKREFPRDQDDTVQTHSKSSYVTKRSAPSTRSPTLKGAALQESTGLVEGGFREMTVLPHGFGRSARRESSRSRRQPEQTISAISHWDGSFRASNSSSKSASAVTRRSNARRQGTTTGSCEAHRRQRGGEENLQNHPTSLMKSITGMRLVTHRR